MSTPVLPFAGFSWLEQKLYKRPVLSFLVVTVALLLIGAIFLLAIYAALLLRDHLGGPQATPLSFIEPSAAIAGATIGLSVSFAGALVAIILARRAVVQADESRKISERQAAIDETNLFRDFILDSGLLEAGVRDAKEVLPFIAAIYEASIELQIIATERELRHRLPDDRQEDWEREAEIEEARDRGYQLDEEDENFVGPLALLNKEADQAMAPHRARIAESLQALSDFLVHLEKEKRHEGSVLPQIDSSAVAASAELFRKGADDDQFRLGVTEPNVSVLAGTQDVGVETWLAALFDEAALNLRHPKPSFLDDHFHHYLAGRKDQLRQMLMVSALRTAPADYLRCANTLPKAGIFVREERKLEIDYAAAIVNSALHVTSTDRLYRRIEEATDGIERIADYRGFILESARLRLGDVRRDAGRISELFGVVEHQVAIDVCQLDYLPRGDGELRVERRCLGGQPIEAAEAS
ncbi:hypothetical protein G0P98_19955 [Yangia sp. PrR004]|nr:hypothetical protein [Salipiger sp. PrR004]